MITLQLPVDGDGHAPLRPVQRSNALEKFTV
jgi:hypothetical protein